MSIERSAKRALWTVFMWRLIGECFVLPQVILKAIVAALTMFGQFFKNLEMAMYTMELAAARRYMLLTDLDLGRASGDGGRYHGLRPEVQDAQPMEFLAEDDE